MVCLVCHLYPCTTEGKRDVQPFGSLVQRLVIQEEKARGYRVLCVSLERDCKHILSVAFALLSFKCFAQVPDKHCKTIEMLLDLEGAILDPSADAVTGAVHGKHHGHLVVHTSDTRGQAVSTFVVWLQYTPEPAPSFQFFIKVA